MDAEIKAIIESIDRAIEKYSNKLRSLRQAREEVIKRFGETNLNDDKQEPQAKPKGKPTKPTRKEEIIAWFKAHGRHKTEELHEGTNIPLGSIHWILSDKTTFDRDEQGRYGLKDETEHV
jgi:hypothetical protein